jgi:hypothetical protein
MKTLSYFIRLVILSIFGLQSVSVYSQDTSFISFANIFRKDSLPFNSTDIRNNKDFSKNYNKKYRINEKYVIEYIIKDSSDIGFKYISEGMDNNRKEERYYKNRFYAYSKIILDSNKYLILYKKEDIYSSEFYLNIYNNHGLKLLNFQITGEELDTYFFKSEIRQDLSIRKVYYRYIEKNLTLIEEELYILDLKTNKYNLDTRMTKYTNHFYYDYVYNIIDDDPLKKQPAIP